MFVCLLVRNPPPTVTLLTPCVTWTPGQARAKEMLLCDGCDHGWHMGCLTPPLEEEPLAHWFCPTCILDQVRA